MVSADTEPCRHRFATRFPTYAHTHPRMQHCAALYLNGTRVALCLLRHHPEELYHYSITRAAAWLSVAMTTAALASASRHQGQDESLCAATAAKRASNQPLAPADCSTKDQLKLRAA